MLQVSFKRGAQLSLGGGRYLLPGAVGLSSFWLSGSRLPWLPPPWPPLAFLEPAGLALMPLLLVLARFGGAFAPIRSLIGRVGPLLRLL